MTGLAARPVALLRWAVVFASLLTGCAGPRCAPDGGQPMQVYELFFGRAIKGGGAVSDAAWTAFRDTVISANLPDGYTIMDAEGAWRSAPDQPTSTERTTMLLVALPDGAEGRAAINRVRRLYQERFDQQSVGMIVHPACASF